MKTSEERRKLARDYLQSDKYPPKRVGKFLISTRPGCDTIKPFDLPTIPSALEFRMDQMGWNQTQLGERLGLSRSHMSEILRGKRPLPLDATKKAFALGVPASVLLQS